MRVDQQVVVIQLINFIHWINNPPTESQQIYQSIRQLILSQQNNYIPLNRSMGNSNNTQIQYWTKSGHKISYLFWDLKGRNRFPQQPSDHQITILFNRCLQEIDISSYQLKGIQQFTPKYKYRFVVLHKKRVKQLVKQQQMMKYSRQLNHQTQHPQTSNTMQSKKKTHQLQKLLMNIELNQTSIKSTLMELQRFISQGLAQNQFIEIKGIERILGHLDGAIGMNQKGTKTSFASQIQLLKFLRIFSDRYPKLYYTYLSQIRTYATIILQSYHPINTQIIAYSLSLLSDFAWRVQPQHQQDSLIRVLQKYSKQMNMQSFLSPFIESIVESQSIVNVYHNVKFVNELMASVMGKGNKELLEETLRRVQYGVVLENVKLRLQGMYYSIQKTTFISIYQKIFKHALSSSNNIKKKHRIDQIIEQNYRNSVLFNHRNSLQILHQQAIVNLIQTNSQMELENSQIEVESSNQLVTYLSDNDRRQFNKVVFDTLTEMQKYYKLQFYLQTTHQMQQSSNDSNYQKAKQLIDDRIIQHNIQTYFNKIKRQSTQNKSIEILNRCLQKIQNFTIQQWKELEKWIYQGSQEMQDMKREIQALREELEEKKSKIKMLIKENHQLKTKQVDKQSLQSNILNPPPSLQQALNTNALKPPPSLQDALNINNTQNNNSTSNTTFLIPSPPLPIGLPSIPILNIALPVKQKPKRQPPKPLKSCNYTTIAYDKIKDSVFEQIDDMNIKIDQNQLVQLFAKTTQTISQSSKLTRSTLLSTVVNGGIRSERLTLPGSLEQIVQLLRPDRAKNIEIVLTKLKIPKGQFKKMLIECNGGKFMSHHTLQSIQKILPTEQEQQLISSFDGNEKDLGVSEKFLKQLIQVPGYASRIKAMIFSHENEEIYHQIESKITQLTKGFTSLKNNSRLKCVIENCLAIGNFLNGQSVRGGAWGFRLQTIQRLQQVKTSDGKMNAALYLVKQLWNHYKYPIFDREEIELYQYLAKMPLSQVKNQIDKLQVFSNNIYKASKSKDESNDKDQIDVFCSNFKQTISTKLLSFKTQFQQLKDLFVKCARYYCEDSKTLASDEFGKKLYQCILFVSNTQKMYKLIEEQNIKSSKYRASTKSISYRESASSQQLRESLIDIRQQDVFDVEKKDYWGLSGTTAVAIESAKKREQRVSFKKKQSVSETIHLADLNQSSAITPITHSNSRASNRLSFIFQIHKPTKPLEQLSHEEIQTQLKAIQREALDREMQSMIRRRTQKFQMITAKFNKDNMLVTVTDNKAETELGKTVLKNA